MTKLDDVIAELSKEYPNPITHDNGVDREMTDAEKAEWYEFAAKEKIKAEQLEADLQAKKLAAEAKLAVLGLDADDLKALGLA